MKKNMGGADRLIRLFVAVVLIALGVSGVVTGTLEIVLYVVAVVFVLTSLINFCPLYTLFGLNTARDE